MHTTSVRPSTSGAVASYRRPSPEFNRWMDEAMAFARKYTEEHNRDKKEGKILPASDSLSKSFRAVNARIERWGAQCDELQHRHLREATRVIIQESTPAQEDKESTPAQEHKESTPAQEHDDAMEDEEVLGAAQILASISSLCAPTSTTSEVEVITIEDDEEEKARAPPGADVPVASAWSDGLVDEAERMGVTITRDMSPEAIRAIQLVDSLIGAFFEVAYRDATTLEFLAGSGCHVRASVLTYVEKWSKFCRKATIDVFNSRHMEDMDAFKSPRHHTLPAVSGWMRGSIANRDRETVLRRKREALSTTERTALRSAVHDCVHFINAQVDTRPAMREALRIDANATVFMQVPSNMLSGVVRTIQAIHTNTRIAVERLARIVYYCGRVRHTICESAATTRRVFSEPMVMGADGTIEEWAVTDLDKASNIASIVSAVDASDVVLRHTIIRANWECGAYPTNTPRREAEAESEQK